jgi:hypothetical protein
MGASHRGAIIGVINMGSERRKSIKREGRRMFAPDSEPCYTYNGKTLTSSYDRKCFLEGWDAESNDYRLLIEMELAEND